MTGIAPPGGVGALISGSTWRRRADHAFGSAPAVAQTARRRLFHDDIAALPDGRARARFGAGIGIELFDFRRDRRFGVRRRLRGAHRRCQASRQPAAPARARAMFLGIADSILARCKTHSDGQRPNDRRWFRMRRYAARRLFARVRQSLEADQREIISRRQGPALEHAHAAMARRPVAEPARSGTPAASRAGARSAKNTVRKSGAARLRRRCD